MYACLPSKDLLCWDDSLVYAKIYHDEAWHPPEEHILTLYFENMSGSSSFMIHRLMFHSKCFPSVLLPGGGGGELVMAPGTRLMDLLVPDTHQITSCSIIIYWATNFTLYGIYLAPSSFKFVNNQLRICFTVTQQVVWLQMLLTLNSLHLNLYQKNPKKLVQFP